MVSNIKCYCMVLAVFRITKEIMKIENNKE